MNKTLLIMTTLATLIAMTAQADDHQRHCNRDRHHNYILGRQEAGLVRGVPTSRLIIGKREIDIYPNGLMFEGDHVVGVRGGR